MIDAMRQTNALNSVVRIFMSGICVAATMIIGKAIGTSIGMMQLLPIGTERMLLTVP